MAQKRNSSSFHSVFPSIVATSASLHLTLFFPSSTFTSSNFTISLELPKSEIFGEYSEYFVYSVVKLLTLSFLNCCLYSTVLAFTQKKCRHDQNMHTSTKA